MTEQELRARLNRMTGEIPAETHQAYLSAVLRGKDEVRVKRKIPAGLLPAAGIFHMMRDCDAGLLCCFERAACSAPCDGDLINKSLERL